MFTKVHKSRIAACIKGLKDAGLLLRTKKEKEIFPSEDRLFGRHLPKEMQEIVVKVKEKIMKE
jgi:hypothetical protein